MYTLTENRIIEYLEKHDKVLINDIVNFLDIPRSTVNYALKRLMYNNIVNKTKEQKNIIGRPKNLWSLINNEI